jgi:DNA modification methylase
MFSREGDLVLDPFAGYGSIPLVCELFNRRWLAVEVDEVKYMVAEKVIKSRKVPDIKKLKEEIMSRRKGKTIEEFMSQSSRPTSRVRFPD